MPAPTRVSCLLSRVSTVDHRRGDPLWSPAAIVGAVREPPLRQSVNSPLALRQAQDERSTWLFQHPLIRRCYIVIVGPDILGLLNNPACSFLAKACGLLSVAEGKAPTMKCPACAENTPDRWLPLMVVHDTDGQPLNDPAEEIQTYLEPEHSYVCRIEWMQCANPKCRRIVVQAYEQHVFWRGGMGTGPSQKWFAVPRQASGRQVHPSVLSSDKDLAELYSEASLILDVSPRASAVLSRRVLADLLKKYAGRNEYGLTARIDQFNKDSSHPSALRDNLHYLREMGDFAAHTQEDDQANIVNVAREEAEWTLDIVDRLFDYFVVTPARDAAMRAKMDEKLDAAGRKPIKRVEPHTPDENSPIR